MTTGNNHILHINKHRNSIKHRQVLQVKKFGLLLLLAVFMTGLTNGCQGSSGETGRKEIEFTVVDREKLPSRLSETIEKNKKSEIRMAYTDGEDMYLVRGYGEQKTGGYSISVTECSEDDTSVFFDTRLLGPEKAGDIPEEPSCPYLAVKIEARDKEVMIR